MNKPYAKEWLIKSWHNLSAAKMLYDAGHYLDVIAVELHYALEKMLKSLLAYENSKIPKTHDLLELHSLISDNLPLDDEKIDILDMATSYHILKSYPVFDKKMLSKEEIERVIALCDELLVGICSLLEIAANEVTDAR